MAQNPHVDGDRRFARRVAVPGHEFARAIGPRGACGPNGARGARAVLPLLAALIWLGGCATRTTVRGTYAEVWEKSQQAVSEVRFKAANTAAMHQRIEKDERAGTIKYVWTDGSFYDSRVLTLRIRPAGAADSASGGAAGSAASRAIGEATASADASIDRMVTIEAWTWAFFGLLPAGDLSTAEIVRLSIEKQFAVPSEPEPPLALSAPQATERVGPDAGSRDGGS